jgi:cytochrome P450
MLVSDVGSHNVITVMIAGHDTATVLLTLLIRLLASDQAIYASIAKGTQLNPFYTIEKYRTNSWKFTEICDCRTRGDCQE